MIHTHVTMKRLSIELSDEQFRIVSLQQRLNAQMAKTEMNEAYEMYLYAKERGQGLAARTYIAKFNALYNALLNR